MSFQDVVRAVNRSRNSNVQHGFRSSSGSNVQDGRDPAPRLVTKQTASQKLTKRKKSRSLILHGRVLRVVSSSESSSCDEESSPTSGIVYQKSASFSTSRQSSTRDNNQSTSAPASSSIRSAMQRKSAFSLLANETQQYQKMVMELAQILEHCGESPELAWRARILTQSTQEMDKDLLTKLYKYEKSLMIRKSSSPLEEEELRAAQTACMKLHRDFNRSHKSLVMALSSYERRQTAEVSRLGAVGWSAVDEEKEDFYERAMREREAELLRINRSMHQISDIYNELATLVENQKDKIDALEDDIRSSKDNVEAGANQFACASTQRDHLCGVLSEASDWYESFGIARDESHGHYGDKEGSRGDDYYWSFPFAEDEKIEREDVEKTAAERDPALRVGEDFYWGMPLETLAEDMRAVREDIVKVGRVMMQSNPLQKCGTSSGCRL